MSSDHLQRTIVALEQELESHQQSCHELEQALVPLRRLVNGHAPVRRRATPVQKSGRRKRAENRGRMEHAAAILAALRAKSPQSPSELAKTLKLHSASSLNYQVKPLLQSGAVIATGATANRQLALPRSRAAKEAP